MPWVRIFVLKLIKHKLFPWSLKFKHEKVLCALETLCKNCRKPQNNDKFSLIIDKFQTFGISICMQTCTWITLFYFITFWYFSFSFVVFRSANFHNVFCIIKLPCMQKDRQFIHRENSVREQNIFLVLNKIPLTY